MPPTMNLYAAALLLVCAQTLAALERAQIPLQANEAASPVTLYTDSDRDERPLHGRFLHITDFHPDPFYKVSSSTSEEDACHRGEGPAGIYGAEMSECDSPVALVNKTMDFIARELKGKIDFIIWTGDSARHDNDEKQPRSKDQVLGLNRFMLQKMSEVFGKHNGDERDGNPNNDFTIPIVPTFGNNDILPHNILAKGPNEWTRAYATLWRQLVPEAQQHSFQQGGWFYVEVIPNRLAVFSLNTMYFFTSNSAADGCAVHSEPGYRQMEWLRIQLQFMRDRGVKAIIMGHVPPVRQEAKTSWDETCWQKYTLWTRQYRDVIVSGLFGHFNYDHFIFQDFEDLDKDTKKGRMPSYDTAAMPDEDFSATGKTSYFLQLRDEWSALPQPPQTQSMSWFQRAFSWYGQTGKKKDDKNKKKYLEKMGGKYAERFSATFVSASVVPNLFPTLRVFEYNTTGLGHSKHDAHNDLDLIDATLPEWQDSELDATGKKDKKKKKKKKKKEKKYKFTIPDPPSKSTPPGPAYSPQTLSLIKYTQYYANLTYIHNDTAKPSGSSHAVVGSTGSHDDKPKRHPHPRHFEYEMLYDTQDDKVYRLQDLTMPNVIDLARRIGQYVAEEEEDARDIGGHVNANAESGSRSGRIARRTESGKQGNNNSKTKKKKRKHWKQNEPWYTFVSRAFVDTMSLEEIEEEFG